MTLSCSAGSLAAAEPMAGTAPLAHSWIIIEQPGPWGRQALTDSRLDPELGAALKAASAESGTTVLLARHPDRLERDLQGADPQGGDLHAREPLDRTDGAVRNIWVAHTAPGDTRMRHGVTGDLSQIGSWDLSAIARGSLPPFGVSVKDSILFICTHSGRDQCCAVHGRALLGAALGRLPGHERATVWEVSHIGGHRFAPTALSLPSGAVYGRLGIDDVLRIREDDARRIVSTLNYRGRSSFPQPLQLAEIAVRDIAGVLDRDVLDVLLVHDGRAIPVKPGGSLPDTTALQLEVRHVDGRAWQVTVRREALATRRAESCGGEELDALVWRTAGVSQATRWA